MIVSFINSKTGEEVTRDFPPIVNHPIDEKLLNKTIQEFTKHNEEVDINQLLDYIHNTLKVYSVQTTVYKITF